MTRFEVGKRYTETGWSGQIVEIVSRTEKTVKYVIVQHAGRYNEKKGEARTKKIKIWNDKEVFYDNEKTMDSEQLSK